MRPTRMIGVLTAMAIWLVACGNLSGTAGTSGADTGTKKGAEANNGEAPAVPYVDARYHYRIDAPGRMTNAADGTASVIGPAERLQVTVVEGSKAADVAALARDDVASLPGSTNGFKLVSGPGAASVNGKKLWKFVYNWNAGTNAVTGKPLSLVGVRYYAPKDASMVAVITYGVASNQYDPQGADDIASTFRWQ